jgi:hypothetical protein
MDIMNDEITELVESREVHDIRRVERFVPEVIFLFLAFVFLPFFLFLKEVN